MAALQGAPDVERKGKALSLSLQLQRPDGEREFQASTHSERSPIVADRLRESDRKDEKYSMYDPANRSWLSIREGGSSLAVRPAVRAPR